MMCDIRASREAFQPAADSNQNDPAVRMRELCQRLRSELAEMENLGLTLPAALLDNAIAEIEQDLVNDRDRAND